MAVQALPCVDEYVDLVNAKLLRMLPQRYSNLDNLDLNYQCYAQNHIDTEKQVDSLRIPCHQPGGKNNKSPGPNTTLIASGTTFSRKSEKLQVVSPELKTSMRDVFRESLFLSDKLV